MRIHILSDIHLEFLRRGPLEFPFQPVQGLADVVVFAGDIGSHPSYLHSFAAMYEGTDTHLVFIAGNHEFYEREHGRWLQRFRDEAAAVAAPMAGRVHFLENDQVLIHGVRFLGATGWTDFAASGDLEQGERESQRVMCDFGCIRVQQTGALGEAAHHDRLIRTEDMRRMNHNTRHWLAQRLAEPFDGPTVVVTHHAPTQSVLQTPAKLRAYGRSHVDSAFGNAWDQPGPQGEPALLGPHSPLPAPALWIYGHTHFANDSLVGRTRVLTNPYGYPGESRTGFQPRCVVEI